MTQPQLRRLTPEDLSALLSLCHEHAAFERASPPTATIDGLAAILLDDPRSRCWVLEAMDGELVGFASASLELSTWSGARYLHLDCLFLRPALRGQGWGRRFMQVAAATAIEWGAVEMQWQTPTWNEDAIGFYRALGAGSRDKLRFTMGSDDIKRHAEALVLTDGPDAAATSGRPINRICPWSGKAVNGESTTRYRGRLVGFCNPGCRDQFAQAVRAFDEMIDASAG